ncbi:SH3 domain-containing protein [Runella sp. SP2]|uniref:SH3 domain-containing protein n=1 Tax=Runella sp. SP2 TaxID=2268026 RepID=UPI000F074D28|nr:SH3 domain-containing protein [Runella sp. SP2]AYQ31637.1 SH3 domain-containing protein [Runella sp. SP2]
MKNLLSILFASFFSFSVVAQEYMIAHPKVSAFKNPASTGATAGTYRIGTKVKLLEKSANGKFLKVSQEKGATGWVASAQVVVLDKPTPKEVSLGIARSYNNKPKEGGAANVEVENWLNSLKTDKMLTPTELAEVEFFRLVTIQRIARSIPFGTNELKSWTDSHKKEVYYSDFGNAGHFLQQDLLWKLETTVPATDPLKERIAYEASQLETGGECEGYWVCVLDRALSKSGEYLKRHPKGKNANTLVQSVLEEFKYLDPAEVKSYDAADQKLAKKSANDWKNILSKTAESAEKKQLIALLNKF